MAHVAICFYGVPRSLKHTHKSIFRRVIGPAKSLAEIRVIAHFFDERTVLSVNGAPDGSIDAREAQLLRPDHLEIEEPNLCLAHRNFEDIIAFGDAWKNENISTRNLVHQLHSINATTVQALRDGAEIVVFVRPDLKYWDSLKPVLQNALEDGPDRVYLPAWQSWGGYNDRFAVAVGPKAIEAYGQRVTQMLNFCQDTDAPLHSELLLKYCLDKSGLPVEFIPNRASRMRASGIRVWESFGDDEATIRHQVRKAFLWNLLDRSGLKPLAKKGFRFWKSLRQ